MDFDNLSKTKSGPLCYNLVSNKPVSSKNVIFNCLFWLTLITSIIASDNILNVQAYGPNFYNKTGCLYAYMEDGHYLISIPDVAELETGTLKGISYDDSRSSCINVNGDKTGLLVFSFAISDNFMHSMTLEFSIKLAAPAGYWEINKAILKINPVNTHTFPKDTIELKVVELYAGEHFSFSCNSLVLQNLILPGKDASGPSFKITLKRFQLQPFGESEKVVFAPSNDCSVWLTLPLVSGLILTLFIIFTVMVGVYLLAEQGNQTGDLKFSKQGGMLMNQAQLDSTKG